MEHYDGEFYTLRLFSPIEGEIYSLNSTEEGTHLTAYEMENYSSFIRDHMEDVGLLGKRNQKLMTYFNNAKRLHKPVSLSLDLEAYEGRLWSVLQADSQDKLTHEEVQSLAETWGDDCCWRLYQRNARDKDPGTRWRTYGFSWK